MRIKTALLSVVLLTASGALRAEDPYVEPGSLRLSHDFTFEGMMHRTTPGWGVSDDGLNKVYRKDENAGGDWQTEWGQNLTTEVATRLTRGIFGRVLFDMQGQYADRFWRPINEEHRSDNEDEHIFLRQAEAKIDQDDWYLHGFSGVGHGDWVAQGDFFGLYPESRPDNDYLGFSGKFVVYPPRYTQDLFLNISGRHVPNGFEGGGQFYGMDGAVAYGDELTWGYGQSVYGRLTMPIRSTKLTFAFQNEDVPDALVLDEDERNPAYALSWDVPSELGHRMDVGVLYNPYREGDPYLVARDADAGSGLLGSATQVSEKVSKKEDGLGARLRLEGHLQSWQREWIGTLDMTRLGILAGNKEEVEVGLGTDLLSVLHGNIRYTYRRPIEGPIPFLYEGTPDNIGAVAASPRGPESPFTVNWDNREAVFIKTTFVFDPQPGTSYFLYNPETFQTWNMNPNKRAPVVIGVQYNLSDYRTTTDRQYYYDENGNIQFEPAAHSGAWASDGFLQEGKLFAVGKTSSFNWTLGFAAGQSPAPSGLAYSNDTSKSKGITDYYSVEGQWERNPLMLWAHYGWGVWGPEHFQYFFGEAFDRLWGLGVSYKITINTTLDVSYLAARQDDAMFVAPDLGSYDEVRTLFSHRFGFLFQFEPATRPGYKAP